LAVFISSSVYPLAAHKVLPSAVVTHPADSASIASILPVLLLTLLLILVTLDSIFSVSNFICATSELTVFVFPSKLVIVLSFLDTLNVIEFISKFISDIYFVIV
jgi:hypothetical protein